MPDVITVYLEGADEEQDALTAFAQSTFVVSMEGPPGPPGAAPIIYNVSNVSTWTQSHDRTYPPEVRVVTSSGQTALVTVEYPDSSHVSLTFPTPFTGQIIIV